MTHTYIPTKEEEALLCRALTRKLFKTTYQRGHTLVSFLLPAAIREVRERNHLSSEDRQAFIELVERVDESLPPI